MIPSVGSECFKAVIVRGTILLSQIIIFYLLTFLFLLYVAYMYVKASCLTDDDEFVPSEGYAGVI